MLSAFTSYSGYGSAQKSGTIGGVTLGVGAEACSTPDVSVKSEYRWTHLNGINLLTATTNGAHTPATGSTGSIDEHSIRFVLSLKIH